MSTSPEDRADRIDRYTEQLSASAKTVIRRMAEELADLPEDEIFGEIEVRLRDLGLEIARQAQQAAAHADQKRGM